MTKATLYRMVKACHNVEDGHLAAIAVLLVYLNDEKLTELFRDLFNPPERPFIDGVEEKSCRE